MNLSLRALNAAGSLVLDISPENGYETRLLPPSEEKWRRIVAASWCVDGDSPVMETLESLTLEGVTAVSGSSWSQVEQRRLALRSAMSGQSLWLLEIGVEGVTDTWRASRADSSSPRRISDIKNLKRVVSWSVPVQPTATVTGV